MRLSTPLGIAFLLVGFGDVGCATNSAPAPTTPPPAPQLVIRLQCLPMASYTPAEQKQAAKELQGLAPGSELGKMMVDYGALRAADRACQSQR